MWRKRLLRFLVAGAVLVFLVSGAALFLYTRPLYGWLTFGPREKLRLLICDRGLWIALTQFVDGTPSRVDHFRNWKACDDLMLNDPDGHTTYTLSRFGIYSVASGPKRLVASVSIKGPLIYEQYCDLPLVARDPQSAKVAHFHGPLTVGPVTINWKLPKHLALRRGDKPTTLRAFVGTMDETRGCWVVIRSHDREQKPYFPRGVHPVVDVEFPAKSAELPAIRQQFPLDHVCCGALFYGPVRVPDEAGDGMAKITFSFPAWSDASVASTT